MGNLFSKEHAKYDFLPIDSGPISSFESIRKNQLGKLWNEGFRCPGCGFYLEKGVLRLRFLIEKDIFISIAPPIFVSVGPRIF